MKQKNILMNVKNWQMDQNDSYGLALNLFNRATIAYARNDLKKAGSYIKKSREILTRDNIKLSIEDETGLNDLEKLLKE